MSRDAEMLAEIYNRVIEAQKYDNPTQAEMDREFLFGLIFTEIRDAINDLLKDVSVPNDLSNIRRQ